jgi:hypothetical protein
VVKVLGKVGSPEFEIGLAGVGPIRQTVSEWPLFADIVEKVRDDASSCPFSR